ncbi:MAG TPA: coenzyme F420-0:L-glutamate ligase [Candidatus Paceibacterota bacterium]|nr:coenzyme F420-0:L-glutamate ligase [Candidatus Paceibacterota bacterium]
MQWLPIKTRTLFPPKDDLFAVFDESLVDVQEGDIVLVTSKVLAIHQGRCVPIADVASKDELIKQEAEKYIDRSRVPGNYAVLTLKHHTLIASAGIDESNANGHYILWPENIDEATKEICRYLRKKHNVKNLGVILTDSHTIPMRWGVLGISISHYGFEPLADLRGTHDLFGRALTITRQNIPDALAAFGVLLMGEGSESTPILVARGYPATFTEEPTMQKLVVDPSQDIYKPLLDAFE